MAIPPKNLSFSPEDLAGQERKAKRQDQAGAFASWLNSMTIRPDPNLPAQLQAARGERVEGLRKNRTVNMLEQAGQTELANLVKAGTLDAKSAASQMFQLAAEERQFAKQKGLVELEASLRKPKVSTAEQKIQRLMETGLDRATAIAIADGRIGTSKDPITGEVTLIDKATGSVISKAPQGMQEVATDPTSADDIGMFDSIDVSRGLAVEGMAKNFINILTDAVGAGQAFPETGEAVNALRNLQTRTTVMAGVRVEGRPSNFTRQEILKNFTISPAEFSTGRDTALQKARDMVEMLEQTYVADKAAAENRSKASAEQRRYALQNLPNLEILLRDYRSLKNSLERSLIETGKDETLSGVAQVSPEGLKLIQKYQKVPYHVQHMLPSPR